jgi:mRNA (guanine-N7-)-methyltransferase
MFRSLIYTISRLAAKYDLYPLYKKEFHELFEEFHEHPEFKPLLQRMNVVDANGESEMNDDQWEAASTSFPSHVACTLVAN